MGWFKRKQPLTPTELGSELGSIVLKTSGTVVQSEFGWQNFINLVHPRSTRKQCYEGLLILSEFALHRLIPKCFDSTSAAAVGTAAGMFVEGMLKAGEIPQDGIAGYYELRRIRFDAYDETWRSYERALSQEPGEHFRNLLPMLSRAARDLDSGGDENIASFALFGVISGIAEDMLKILGSVDLREYGAVDTAPLISIVQDFKVTAEVVRKLAKMYPWEDQGSCGVKSLTDGSVYLWLR